MKRVRLVLDSPDVSDRVRQIFDTWRDLHLTQGAPDASDLRSAMRRPLVSLLLNRDVVPVTTYFQALVRAWVETVERWDWTQRKVETYSHHRTTIERYIQQGRRIKVVAKDKDAHGYLVVEEESAVLPCTTRNENALLLSLLFRQYDLFERLAGAYRITDEPRDEGFSLNTFLLHLARNQPQQMEQELAKHSGKYGRDAAHKPKYLELLQGLSKRDEKLLVAGLTMDAKQHDLMWSCKRYAKGPIKTFKPWKLPTYQSELELHLAVAEDLVNCGWAQAYLSGAAVSFWVHFINAELTVPQTPWIRRPQA